jgi:LysR family hydrogen peroxide-inducible transcriptional activator
VLFDRSKKPILLTDTGKKIIDQIQNVLFEAKKIESLIESSTSEIIQGELIVGVIPTIAPYLLPLLLPNLEKNFPQLKLRVREMQTHRIVDALQSDEIDVGILATPLGIKKVIETPLYYEPFYVLCKSNHPLSKTKKIKYSSLKFEDIWLLEEGHCLRNQVVDICALKEGRPKKRQFEFESGSIETLKGLVNSFGGFTLIPHLAKDHIGEDSLVIGFERPAPSREIGLVHQRAHYKNHLIKALEETILNSIPAELTKFREKDLKVIGID